MLALLLLSLSSFAKIDKDLIKELTNEEPPETNIKCKMITCYAPPCPCIQSSDDESDDIWMIDDSTTNKTSDSLESMIEYIRNHSNDTKFMESLTELLSSLDNSTVKTLTAVDFIQHLSQYVPTEAVKSKEFWKFVTDVLPVIVPLAAKDKSISEEEFWKRIGSVIGAIAPQIIPYINTNDSDFGKNKWVDDVVGDMDKAINEDKRKWTFSWEVYGEGNANTQNGPGGYQSNYSGKLGFKIGGSRN